MTPSGSPGGSRCGAGRRRARTGERPWFGDTGPVPGGRRSPRPDPGRPAGVGTLPAGPGERYPPVGAHPPPPGCRYSNGSPDRGLCMRIGTNGLARRVHVALLVLLSLGVAGSFWMGIRTRSAARDRAAEQARVIPESSLTLVFRPDDLERPASEERTRELSRSISDVVLDASDFETGTVFSPSGLILY